ncbi:d-aminoacid aminotransferase-like plp-dependent enzyme-like protein [Nannochloropsis gaditana]|uniref:D-aminoacid aminotransferase-like plp-dependent enzyme-like protein n=1 Tax=Nannochloropsis gaditana TaxID=72520 RepID=W7TQE6_9STRA|nr:d-aminoacid aminotransferase-like plp-dependent enzyme-like protein [Nannochloropsis gaditana]EWM25728.1 d-aminoacid aminotransferase-like plp-dependent enzyme-like protein [Nannochloropsis gaditana]
MGLQPGLERPTFRRPILPSYLYFLLFSMQPIIATSFSAGTLTSLTPQNPPPPASGVSVRKTPRQFLMERPPGPYTCLRARDESLLGFDFHFQRLLHGIESSVGCMSPVNAGELRKRVLNVIEEALTEASQQHPSEDGKEGSTGSTEKLRDFFVTVHIDESSIVLPSSTSGVALSAHAVSMPYAVMPPPVTLEIRGEGRRSPDVKHSQWLRDRQGLERFRVGPGGEVALSRSLPAGRGEEEGKAGKAGREVLEGLVSNIFVVKGGKLLTASDGILPGHMRTMALRAAEALGVPVGDPEEKILLEDILEWEEAFLTGSGRVLVPIGRVEGTSVGLPPVDLAAAPGPITNLVRARLLYDMEDGWENLRSLASR